VEQHTATARGAVAGAAAQTAAAAAAERAHCCRSRSCRVWQLLTSAVVRGKLRAHSLKRRTETAEVRGGAAPLGARRRLVVVVPTPRILHRLALQCVDSLDASEAALNIQSPRQFEILLGYWYSNVTLHVSSHQYPSGALQQNKILVHSKNRSSVTKRRGDSLQK